MRRTLAILAVLSSPLAAAELRVDGGSRSLGLAEHTVLADVDNRLALTRVQQVFENDSDDRLEGVYVFPVPAGASLVDFAMWVGERKVRAAVVEKATGRMIYDSYKNRGRDPALLEHVSRNVFQAKVFPIEPHSRVRIEVVYREIVEYEGGFCRYVYPVRSSQGTSVRTGTFRLEVQVRSEIPIRSLASQSEGGRVEVRSDREGAVVFEKEDAQIADDFAVLYRLAGDRTALGWIAHRPDPASDGHFLLVVSPDEEGGRDAIASKDMTFVVDVSGSMAGEKIEQARRALESCVRSLGPSDRFEILSFSNDVTSFAGGLVPADRGERARASAWIASLESGGGTAIDAALGRALASGGEGRPHLVVLLTDGQPTVGERDPRKIVEHAKAALRPGARVYTFGIGTPADYDRDLLDMIARETGGAHDSVAPGEDIEFKVSRFQEKVAHPVLVDLAIDWGGAPVRDVQPLRLAPLFRGSQILVLGRFHGAGIYQVALTGRVDERPVRIDLAIELPEKTDAHPAVPSLWASRKVESLLYEMKVGGESQELRDEVVELALEHRLATPYTSYIVLENDEEFRRWNLEEGGAQERGYDVQPVESDHNETANDEAFVEPVSENAVEKDHNETENNEPFNESKGMNMDALSDSPFQGKATNSAIGLGGGAGGAFGGRRSGGAGTETAVGLGLEWLKNHQDPATGGWDSDDFQDQCKKNTCSGRGLASGDVAQTGLALLAFLGAGHTHSADGKYKETVRFALKYLIKNQDAEGCFGPREGGWLWAHAVATLAVTEAYGMTRSPLLRDPAERGIRFLDEARTPGRGWGETPKAEETDTWNTGWALMALKSGRVAELDVPGEAFADAKLHLDRVTDDTYCRTGLRAAGDAGHSPDGKALFGSETCTAISVTCRVFMGADRGDPILRAQGDLLAAALPMWDTAPLRIDYRYWYCGTLAMFQLGGDCWKSWNNAMKAAIVKHQRSDGDERGSWDPIGHWGPEGGRIESTALAAISLEIYYRYDRKFK